jgi:hypothetical protein
MPKAFIPKRRAARKKNQRHRQSRRKRTTDETPQNGNDKSGKAKIGAVKKLSGTPVRSGSSSNAFFSN